MPEKPLLAYPDEQLDAVEQLVLSDIQLTAKEWVLAALQTDVLSGELQFNPHFKPLIDVIIGNIKELKTRFPQYEKVANIMLWLYGDQEAQALFANPQSEYSVGHFELQKQLLSELTAGNFPTVPSEENFITVLRENLEALYLKHAIETWRTIYPPFKILYDTLESCTAESSSDHQQSTKPSPKDHYIFEQQIREKALGQAGITESQLAQYPAVVQRIRRETAAVHQNPPYRIFPSLRESQVDDPTRISSISSEAQAAYAINQLIEMRFRIEIEKLNMLLRQNQPPDTITFKVLLQTSKRTIVLTAPEQLDHLVALGILTHQMHEPSEAAGEKIPLFLEEEATTVQRIKIEKRELTASEFEILGLTKIPEEDEYIRIFDAVNEPFLRLLQGVENLLKSISNIDAADFLLQLKKIKDSVSINTFIEQLPQPLSRDQREPHSMTKEINLLTRVMSLKGTVKWIVSKINAPDDAEDSTTDDTVAVEPTYDLNAAQVGSLIDNFSGARELSSSSLDQKEAQARQRIATITTDSPELRMLYTAHSEFPLYGPFTRVVLPQVAEAARARSTAAAYPTIQLELARPMRISFDNQSLLHPLEGSIQALTLFDEAGRPLDPSTYILERSVDGRWRVRATAVHDAPVTKIEYVVAADNSEAKQMLLLREVSRTTLDALCDRLQKVGATYLATVLSKNQPTTIAAVLTLLENYTRYENTTIQQKQTLKSDDLYSLEPLRGYVTNGTFVYQCTGATHLLGCVLNIIDSAVRTKRKSHFLATPEPGTPYTLTAADSHSALEVFLPEHEPFILDITPSTDAEAVTASEPAEVLSRLFPTETLASAEAQQHFLDALFTQIQQQLILQTGPRSREELMHILVQREKVDFARQIVSCILRLQEDLSSVTTAELTTLRELLTAAAAGELRPRRVDPWLQSYLDNPQLCQSLVAIIERLDKWLSMQVDLANH